MSFLTVSISVVAALAVLALAALFWVWITREGDHYYDEDEYPDD